MKEPSIAPSYVCMYPVLCEIARECGYALAVHGSVSRDFDLIAIAWTEQAEDYQVLVNKFWQYASIFHDIEFAVDHPLRIATIKPHGRLSWCIPLFGGCAIDLSVMPSKR